MATISYARRVPAGASAYVLDSTDLMSSAGDNLSAVLQARVPGLSVLRPGGSAAEGSRVRLRGRHSLLMTTEPIVIVDGIRVNAMQESSVLDVGTRTSRLDDIMPEDIARIDVLPGPAAASLFGPGAAGGALVITTKRGTSGAVLWNARAESRLGMKPTGFPANYDRTGIDVATGQPTTDCGLLQVASGACTPTGLEVWSPLEQASPFRTQRATSGSMSLSGGVGQTSARLSATGHRTLGVTGDDDDGKLGLRANVLQHVDDAIDIGVHGGYTRTSAGLPIRGNFIGSLINNGLFGSARDDARRGYRASEQEGAVRQRATHLLLGASAAWRLKSWLAATAVYGRDRLTQDEELHTVINQSINVVDDFGELIHTTTTTGASLTASYSLFQGRSIGQTILGYERLGSMLTVSDSQRFLTSSSQSWLRHDWTLGGPWLRQQLAWRDRLFVGAALRLEQRRTFGSKAPSAWFKSADASWSLGDGGWFKTVRFRAAYGEGGGWMAGDPGVFARQTNGIDDVSAAEPTERTAESEIGLDARLGDRVNVALTAFRSDASKLWVRGYVPLSNGFSATALPIGAMRTDGLELRADARLVDGRGLRWDATLTAGALRNRLRSSGVFQAYEELRNSPVDPYWTTPYTYDDANHDGIIDTTEVQFSGTQIAAGSSLPTREAGLRSMWTLGGSLTLGALLDYRGGQKLENANERLRCRIGNCRGAQDPSASLAEQAAAVAARSDANSFVQDASFLKLRELSLTWKLPAKWSNSVAGTSAAVTLAGRNLATWTRYKGLDPELDYQRFDALPRADMGKAPLVREIVLRLDVGGGARK